MTAQCPHFLRPQPTEPDRPARPDGVTAHVVARIGTIPPMTPSCAETDPVKSTVIIANDDLGGDPAPRQQTAQLDSLDDDRPVSRELNRLACFGAAAVRALVKVRRHNRRGPAFPCPSRSLPD